MRIKVNYYKQKVPGHNIGKFPLLIMQDLTGKDFEYCFALPAMEYPEHVKVSRSNNIIKYATSAVSKLTYAPCRQYNQNLD